MILYSGKTLGDMGDYQACSSLKERNYLLVGAGA